MILVKQERLGRTRIELRKEQTGGRYWIVRVPGYGEEEFLETTKSLEKANVFFERHVRIAKRLLVGV